MSAPSREEYCWSKTAPFSVWSLSPKPLFVPAYMPCTCVVTVQTCHPAPAA